MSIIDDQVDYMTLYFDLENVRVKLYEARKVIISAMKDMTHVYKLDEMGNDESGMKPGIRPPLDVANRASVSAGLGMLFPLIEHLSHSIAYGQKACQMMCPDLQSITTTPN